MEALFFIKYMAQEQSSQDNFDVFESQQMNEAQQIMFRTITRSKSNDSFLGRIVSNPNEIVDRSVVFDYIPPNYSPTIIITRGQENQIRKNSQASNKCEGGIRVFKKIKKTKVRGKCDYEKNICGYITKKIIRQFVGSTFASYIQKLCEKYGCLYKDCKSFYLSKIEKVTGPSHIPELVSTDSSDQVPIPSVKRVFRQFYGWFLKERYLRYLLIQGKMANKLAYIEYKNNYLFHFIKQAKEKDNVKFELGRQKSRRKSHPKEQDQEQ